MMPSELLNDIAVSWLLFALRTVLGDPAIRQNIIHHYNLWLETTQLSIPTFDAFLTDDSSGKTKTRDEKAQDIITYCEEQCACKKTPVFVFTATNIQEDEDDFDTHYQTFIVDKLAKKVSIIDPAYNINVESGEGIYMAQVAREVVIPYFEEKKYKSEFVSLTNPAQDNEDEVYCQSWSLCILIHKLQNNNYKTNSSFEIPSDQYDKYDMILSFWKQVFTDMPELRETLWVEYEGEIKKNLSRHTKTKLLKNKSVCNTTDLLMKLTKYEI